MKASKKPIAIAIACALGGVWQESTAQTAAAEPATLDPVVIRGGRVEPAPAPAGVLDDKSLVPMRARTSDTADLLRNVPGVNLQGAGGVSSMPVINGLAGDRVRIQVDGMDLIASCPNHMNPPLSYLDPTGVASLKVYAGVSPVSAGGDSIAGSIIATTREPEFAAAGEGPLLKGEIGGFYRSNGNAYGGNVSATLASESLSLSYSGATAQSDNYTAGDDFKNYTGTGRAGHSLALDEVGSTAYETRNHTLGLAFKGGQHLVEAKLGYQDVPFQNYPNQRMDMTENTQWRLNLRYLGSFDWGALEARAYHEKVDHEMDFGDDKRFWYGPASNAVIGGVPVGVPCAPIGPTCAAGMPMETDSQNSGLTLKADVALSQQDLLRVGGEYQRYRLDDFWPPSGGGMFPGTFENIDNGRRDRAALFGEWEWTAAPQWMTSLGLRYEQVSMDADDVQGYKTVRAGPPQPGVDVGNQIADANAFNARDHQRTDNNWNLTALARYTADATRDIEFGFARKVRSPNLYERYTWSTWEMAAAMNNFVGDGNGYIGNLDLEPEKAHTVSATLSWHAADKAWELKATPYYSHVSDYIDAIRCPAGSACTPVNATTTNQFVVLKYANQSARLYGLDVSGQMPLGKTGWGDWGLLGRFNYTNGKNPDTGDELYNIMPLNARLTLTHQVGGWDSAVELVMVDAKDDTSDVRNEIKTGGYSLLNLRTSYTWKKLRVDLGVDNVFDRGYALPLGGAYVGQGRTMALNIPSDGMFAWGTPVPGMGRSLYAGMSYKF